MKFADLERQFEKAIAQIVEVDGQAQYPPGIVQARREIEKHPDHPMADSIRHRIALLDRANSDEAFRVSELQKCEDSAVYWINNWCWTFDPRRKPSNIPFNLFPKQEEFLRWLGDRIAKNEDGIVEKSRDAGLSWLCIAFAAWLWLFTPSSKVTVGSRKADLVDRLGDPDSLFEKIRILLKNLPSWMQPENYTDNELRFGNKANGSSITGEAGEQMGRGGRSSLYFLDEFAFVERAQRVDAAVSENSEVKIYVSTPNGNGNVFAKKRHSGQYPVFRIHWRDDPRKNDAWYAKRKKQLDPVVLAQEIDIDYAASIEGVCIPNAWVMAAINLKLPPAGKCAAGLDVADEGKNKNVMIVVKGPVVRHIEDWAEGDVPHTSWKAKEIGLQHRIKQLNYDAIGSGSTVGGLLRREENLPFEVEGINGSGSVSETKWEQFDDRTSKELFRNRRAELWWLLRRRFEKTYEHVNRKAEHPMDELISIPNHAELINQLSQPLRRFDDAGKILIESKDQMKARGIESPDFADALVYAFARSITDNLGWLAKA